MKFYEATKNPYSMMNEETRKIQSTKDIVQNVKNVAKYVYLLFSFLLLI